MIENYVLHEQIGQGEYGKVYRATDISTQMIVAVKVVDTQKLNDNPKLLELSMTEIKVLQMVSHCPYIIHFIQLIKTPLKYYFVYEYCSGGPLDKKLSLQGHFQEKQALQVLWQLLQAFKTLQANRIMHRDLKPSNILIHNGTYKLADFGFCKPMEERFGDVTTTMLGSPIYMAPEVLRGLSYDNKADVWSLGAVLYELLIGRCPFEEKSIAKLITAQDETDWSIPSQFTIKQQTLTLLKSMLVKDATKRCTWEYLFQVPLNKEGDYVGELRQYEVEAINNFVPLQPLEMNINYMNTGTYQQQQFSIPYSPMNPYKNQYQKEQVKPSPVFFGSLRENSADVATRAQEQSFQNLVALKSQNTYSFEHIKVPELQHQTSCNLPPLPLHSKPKEEVFITGENVLTEVIKERNKIYFLCKALSDMTNLNLIEKSHVSGYFMLVMINRRYQALLKVLKQYTVLQEYKEFPSINALLLFLQRKNSQKRLTNNFEFVRLVDTIEKEASCIDQSLNEYKQQIDSVRFSSDQIDKKEQTLLTIPPSSFNPDQVKQLSVFLSSYINAVRSQHYLAFIDLKSDSDKHIVCHANQLIDCLQIDSFFQEVNKDEVLEDAFDYNALDKKALNERFENGLKKISLLQST